MNLTQHPEDPTIPIFPKVNIRNFSTTIIMETALRKKHTDGKYYLQIFKQEVTGMQLAQAVGCFYSEVYFGMTLGIISPELTVLSNHGIEKKHIWKTLTKCRKKID